MFPGVSRAAFLLGPFEWGGCGFPYCVQLAHCLFTIRKSPNAQNGMFVLSVFISCVDSWNAPQSFFFSSFQNGKEMWANVIFFIFTVMVRGSIEGDKGKPRGEHTAFSLNATSIHIPTVDTIKRATASAIQE